MKEEELIRTLVHEGWAIEIKVAAIDGTGAMHGVAEVYRDGVPRCRITPSGSFSSKERMAAVLIAKADKWISAQAGFGPLP